MITPQSYYPMIFEEWKHSIVQLFTERYQLKIDVIFMLIGVESEDLLYRTQRHL